MGIGVLKMGVRPLKNGSWVLRMGVGRLKKWVLRTEVLNENVQKYLERKRYNCKGGGKFFWD